MLPLGLLPFVVTSAPRMPPGLPSRESFIWQKGGEATLQGVRTAANCMCRIAIITAFAMEAQVASRTHEERFKQFTVGNLVNFSCNIESSTAHRHCPAKPQKPANQKN